MIVAWNGRSGRGPSQRSQSRPGGGARVGRMADPARRHVAGEGRPRHRDLAQRAGVHRLGELRVHPRRAAMHADLDDPVVLPRRVDHRPALDDRHRQRLLDVHVLARPAGGDHLDGVPVVGRRDHDGVDVLAIEHRAEVLDARDVPLDRRHLGDRACPGRRIADRSGHRPRTGRARTRRTAATTWASGCARKPFKSWQPRLPTPMKPSRTRSLAPSTRPAPGSRLRRHGRRRHRGLRERTTANAFRHG